jgi:HAD superfamily hydrolase (TIGR01459 family)
MHSISGIEEISRQYSHFILDVWGVVHDGGSVYPGVNEAISFLRQQGKRICFLSNAPRRSVKVSDALIKLGITSDLYDFVLTSGEVAFLDLKRSQLDGFKSYGKNYFYIGPKKDMDLLEGLDYKKVEVISAADFVITTGFDHEMSILEEKLPQAREARKYNLPMICVNPDMIVVKQDGQEMICAGALAIEYEKLGGRVFYYGKPFSSVYEAVCKIFHYPEKQKIVAIGDGLETDVKGAKTFGIDTVLVTGGVLSNQLGIKYWQDADKDKLEAVCNEYKIYPKYVISNFRL